MKRSLPVPALALLMVLLSPAVHAENEAYGGVGIGYSTYKIDKYGFEGASLATREFLGLQFGDHVAIEGGFHYFGTINDFVAEPAESGDPPQQSVQYGSRTWGYDASVLGIWPLDRELEVFGRLGVIRWDARILRESVEIDNQSGNDAYAGFGVNYRSTGPVSLRIEAEFLDVGDTQSWWVLTTSIIYRIPLRD